jgi:hypothetical protein
VLIVIKFPAVPFTVKVVTVVLISLASNVIECGGVSHLKSLKVFEHLILKAPVPSPVNHKL